MYFTDTPTLNSIEAIMKKLPYGTQKGGGRFRTPYKYTKEDCDCRLYLNRWPIHTRKLELICSQTCHFPKKNKNLSVFGGNDTHDT